MKKLMLSATLLCMIVAPAAAYPLAQTTYHVQTLGVGDDLDKVFKVLGMPQAVQMLGDNNEGGAIQLLYFHKTDNLAIGISDLPENKVVQIELSGKSWHTDAPVQVGDSLDVVGVKLGQPDKVVDLSMQKTWMLEQAGSDPAMQQLINKNSGDTGLWYQRRGLYIEYDKAERLVKTLKIYDPLARLTVKSNKI